MLYRMFNICFLLLLCSISVYCADYSIKGVTDKKVAIYKPDEKIVFTLYVLDGKKPVAGKTIKWTRTGDDEKKESGSGIADENGLKIITSMRKPGFVRIKANAYDENGKKLKGKTKKWGREVEVDSIFEGGAAVEPQLLKPFKEPKDFDEFWQKMKDKLAEIPLKANLKEIPSSNPKLKQYSVTINCPGSNPVTGYLSIPKNAKDKSLPAIVKFHGYGVREHKLSGWVPDNAIYFDVNAHGMKLGQTKEYYTKLKKDLKGYAFNYNENLDATKCYFYGMSLRALRALEYVKSLPQWNGKVLKSNGGSQGGLQALWGAAIDSDVTSCNAWSPWCCDLYGYKKGRISGWRPKYTDALAYYDPAFHAKRIKGQVKLIGNYGDYICPPSGVWVVYNNISNNKKSIVMKQGCTHSYSMKNHQQFTYTPSGVKDIKTSSK